ncbi:MAG: hypothetical protein AB7N80_03970 [Bdellovibrionales bacterium]
MRIPNQAYIVLAVAASLAVFFNNCQQDVGFVSAELKTQGELPPNPTPSDIEKTCQNTTRQSKVVSVNFPKPNMTCEWGVDGNLNERNDYFQARIEQSLEVDIPENTLICNMVFSFNRQQFLYDDHFLMTFNNMVMASSYDYSEFLLQNNGLQTYDWSRIAGQKWDSNSPKEGIFCASVEGPNGTPINSVCDWPVTDTDGTIEMAFPKEIFYAIMARDSKRLKHEFKFVSVGDNDDKDCEHSNLQFDVMVEYVLTK